MKPNKKNSNSNSNFRKSRKSRPKTRRPKLKRRKTRKGGTCQDTNQRALDYMMTYPHPK